MKRFSIGLLFFCLASPLMASEIEGFTEPYRNIDVAAAEPGIIEKIHVKEGERVAAGQLIAELNHDVLKASLAIADKTRNARGKLESAKAESRLKQERLEKLKILLGRNHASQEEVDRTQVEMEVAAADLLNAEEELEIRDLEYHRTMTQIEMRMIRSPIDGWVTKQFVDQGEYVSPTNPVVFNVVQLDPLMAVFSVPGDNIKNISTEQKVTVTMGEQRTPVTGVVEFIAPITDAKSLTTQVKVRLENLEGKLRSGDRCYLNMDIRPTEQQQAIINDGEATPTKSAQVPLIFPRSVDSSLR